MNNVEEKSLVFILTLINFFAYLISKLAVHGETVVFYKISFHPSLYI